MEECREYQIRLKGAEQVVETDKRTQWSNDSDGERELEILARALCRQRILHDSLLSS